MDAALTLITNKLSEIPIQTILPILISSYIVYTVQFLYTTQKTKNTLRLTMQITLVYSQQADIIPTIKQFHVSNTQVNPFDCGLFCPSIKFRFNHRNRVVFSILS